MGTRLSSIDTNTPARKYGRRSDLSACRPGHFTDWFTVHHNEVNGITVVSLIYHKWWSVF